MVFSDRCCNCAPINHVDRYPCILTADCDDGAPGIMRKHECIFVGPQREDRRCGTPAQDVQGTSGPHTFGVGTTSVKRYLKQSA
jgi:hypothetical protein